MADEPLVSVIIPTYNRASMVGQAIKSVLDQTFRRVEIVVVDDGSNDETQRTLEPYDGKILSLVTENRGPGHARNVGMKAASGKYIAFLDSDDMYLPHKLELQVAYMENNSDIGMVSTNFSAMKNNKITEEFHFPASNYIFEVYGWTCDDVYPIRSAFEFQGKKIPCYRGNIFKFMLHGAVLVSNTALFRRHILLRIGYQNEAYPNAQDYDFMVRICKQYSVAFLDNPTYIYCYHDDYQISMVGQPKTREKLRTRIRIVKTFLQTTLDWGYADANYYAENKSWLDKALARQHFELGRMWLEYGESNKARECFVKGHAFDPALKGNRRYFWLSFLPQIARRGVLLAWSNVLRVWRFTR